MLHLWLCDALKICINSDLSRKWSHISIYALMTAVEVTTVFIPGVDERTIPLRREHDSVTIVRITSVQCGNRFLNISFSFLERCLS